MTGSQVRQLRRQLDLTQVQLGELVGVSGNSVARWERDELGIRESAARLMRLLAQQRLGQGVGSGEPTESGAAVASASSHGQRELQQVSQSPRVAGLIREMKQRTAKATESEIWSGTASASGPPWRDEDSGEAPTRNGARRASPSANRERARARGRAPPR